MSVVAAVEHDLAALGDDSVADGALAAAARRLAKDLDSSETSATAASAAAKTLATLMEAIWALAPRAEAASKVDELKLRRETRRSA